MLWIALEGSAAKIVIYANNMKAAGTQHYLWKGDTAGYGAIHSWLLRHFGKATCCENEKCEGKSAFFEWALLKGKTYDHNRENFTTLCSSCHRKYDLGKPELCTVRDCNNKYRAGGYCQRHYNKEYHKTRIYE